MNIKQIIPYISSGSLDEHLSRLYPDQAMSVCRTRYIDAVQAFAELYGSDREVSIFSVPGRSELSGNHTDHNHGQVIAASIDLDIIAVASMRDDSIVHVKSAGFPEDTVDFAAFCEPNEARFGKSDALIAGVVAGFRANDLKVGGFDAYTTSSVLKGSGLSSSAAFEDMIGNILNHFYNDGKVSFVEISKISQYSENKFFGKPCGLMDQVACAAGGIVAIDFADPSSPIVEQVDFDLTAEGYCLCIVDTGGNHADLTDDYAAVPAEMKSVAHFFGKEYLRELKMSDVLSEIPALRRECGDRAILRAIHFFEENRRVTAQKKALAERDLDAYFAGVIASGRSSFCYLQNVYTTKNVSEQGLSLALSLAEGYLSGRKAAFRVHGGGFAGTIQAYVPSHDVEPFRSMMNAAFGEGACAVLHIRPEGAIKLV